MCTGPMPDRKKYFFNIVAPVISVSLDESVYLCVYPCQVVRFEEDPA